MCNENEYSRNKISIIFLFRAKRERERKVTYDTNKCLFELPPFDDHFDPLVHNTYLNRWEKLIVISRILWLRFFVLKKGAGTSSKLPGNAIEIAKSKTKNLPGKQFKSEDDTCSLHYRDHRNR